MTIPVLAVFVASGRAFVHVLSWTAVHG